MKLEWTPLEAADANQPAVSATWASLRIEIEEAGRSQSLTRVLDRVARTERREVYGTVLPLAEWIARCWHSLFSSHLVRPPQSASRHERATFDSTHRWRACGEGTAVPDAEFAPLDDMHVECRWIGSSGDDSDEFERVLFLTHGESVLVRKQLREVFADFVQGVLARLGDVAPSDPRTVELRSLWSTASDPSNADHAGVRLCARLGHHWWALTVPERQKFAARAQTPPNPIADAGVELASGISEWDVWHAESTEIWNRCVDAAPAPTQWRQLRTSMSIDAVPGPTRSPWKRGWDAARELREHARVPADQPWGAQEIVDAIGVDSVQLRNGNARSILGWSAGRRPLIASPPRGTPTVRFAGVRDLYPLLFLGDPSRDFACVLSERIAGVLPVANAFAAELLAPVERIRTEIAGRVRIDGDELAEIADRVDAPLRCVRHQVVNHQLSTLVF